jgi:predicted DNA-binding transcriptional regulator YafY
MPLYGIYNVRVTMRATRLVSLLLLLQLGRRLTAAELAAELGTSIRTVHRDVEALAQAGIPIRAARGRGGGFMLPPAYRARLPLSAEEAQALLVGAPGAATSLGLGALLLDARRKVIASLPADLREATARAEALFHVDEPRWFSRADETPLLTTLVTAATERRRVAVEYRRQDGVAEFMVDPIGFVLKAGVWYAVARREGEIRVYRVSRFSAATVTAVPFRRPPRFDLAAFWERSREEFEASRPRIEVRVRVAPADVPALRAALDPTVQAALDDQPPDRGGRLELALPFERIEYAHADLVKLGGLVEVLAPAGLRQALADTGRQLTALYQGE